MNASHLHWQNRGATAVVGLYYDITLLQVIPHIMPNNFAHNSFWQTSDFIFGTALILGLTLHFIPALSVPFPLPALPSIVVGVVLFVAGVTAIVLGKQELSKAGQPVAPGIPTTQIVETGIYRFTRNPLYLGLVFALVGVGLSFNIAWCLILTPPMFFAMQHILIIPEEKYLLRQFNEQYAMYMSRVRRWL